MYIYTHLKPNEALGVYVIARGVHLSYPHARQITKHLYIHTFTYEHTQTHKHTDAHSLTQSHTHTHTHTHNHTHTQTHTDTSASLSTRAKSLSLPAQTKVSKETYCRGKRALLCELLRTCRRHTAGTGAPALPPPSPRRPACATSCTPRCVPCQGAPPEGVPAQTCTRDGAYLYTDIHTHTHTHTHII